MSSIVGLTVIPFGAENDGIHVTAMYEAVTDEQLEAVRVILGEPHGDLLTDHTKSRYADDAYSYVENDEL